MAKTAVKEPDIGGFDRNDLIEMYRLMVLIRRFEESTYRKYREGKMGGYLHRYDGQEALVAGILAAAAAVMIAGCVLDVARLPLAPSLLAATAAVAGVMMCRAVLRSSPLLTTDRAGVEVAILLSITAAVFGYLLWLASPSLLPVADGPDIVHHLSLVHTIQRTHRLPHDPGMETYLGEMIHYTPGSHVLAAMLGAWLRLDALRVIYPVMAACVAFRSGLLFLVTLRVLPESKSPLHAIAAPVLVMAPTAYFFGSILKYGFYAQVVSEVFAVGMLLSTVLWAQSGARIWLTVFAVCGSAAFLAWPVWVPPAVLVLLCTVLVRRPAIVEGLRELLIAVGPIALVSVLHLTRNRGGASILSAAGDVTMPSLLVFGAGFVALALLGLLLAAWNARGRVVVIFAAAVVLQAIALAAINRIVGSTSLYLPYKMVYLLVLAGAVLGAYALARLAEVVPGRGLVLRAISALVPVAVAVPLMWARIPRDRPRGPITESSYAAGIWARDHLPVACVDYFSRHWLTGYWLHLDLLGNPKAAPRMQAETFDFRDTVGKWIEGRGEPYAIIEDLSSIPHEIRPGMRILYRNGAEAVVQHAGVRCDDQSMSIQEFEKEAER